jgi:hypothetical protein
MVRRVSILIFCAVFLLRATVPTLEEHFGYTPGDDYKLADYSEIIGYFQKLDRASDRLVLREFGRSSHGKPMYAAIISSAENLKRLERYREISRRLALGQAEPEEARRLAEEGKAIVWIDSGLHASEVAPAQHAPHLALRMVTEESEEVRRIRESVILIQIPSINPDGLDWIAHWYRQNVGTPYELARLPWLYQKYAGHDNNRDWFMLNLDETRHVTRLLYEEWFPQIVYNQHQTPAFPARIFVPPYAEPLNPNIPASVMAGIHRIGSAMKERFAREDKPGVLAYHQFDAWWNGGMRSTPAFHNMHGILTETALFSYATPRTYTDKDLPQRFAGGIPSREPSVFYQRPWLGGTWTVRDAIDYILTSDFAILNLASVESTHFLYKAWEMAREAIEAGKRGSPFAYVVPAEQWDRSSAMTMLQRLQMGGIEVRRARAGFDADGKSFPEGSYVLPAAQPFRAYLVDLMEPQKYPDMRTADGAPRRPYDVAGWTLSYQMGVAVERIDAPFEADLVTEERIRVPEPSLDRKENSSFVATLDLLERGTRVRWAADGAILVEGRVSPDTFSEAAYEVRRPRLALYQPWVANMDQGWTQWVLDHFKVPYTLVHNEDFCKGGLRERFDTILLAQQGSTSILHGEAEGQPWAGRDQMPDELRAKTLQRPEYTGGIGIEGLYHLDAFVRAGGTLIALGSATDLPMEFFPLPVRNTQRSPASSDRFFCPGSLLRIRVDTSHPLAFGMPEEAIAFSTGGFAFETTMLTEFNEGEREVRGVAQYTKTDLLASGWISGEKSVLGKDLLMEARHGRGRVVLFGLRPQFRGQSFGTFKFLLNAIFLGSAERL